MRLSCPEWIESAAERSLETRARISQILTEIIDKECLRLPELDMVRSWHRAIFHDSVPLNYYAGNFRDNDPDQPCLQIYEVVVGGVSGTPCLEVIPAVENFVEIFRRRVRTLDRQLEAHGDEILEMDVWEIVRLAAWAHGEWVRIHPFANGNGRTSRLWANYVFCRYGFGPVVKIRPRPGEPYGIAARDSMRHGNHTKTEELFLELLLQSYNSM